MDLNQIIVVEGDLLMGNSRKIGDISNNSFGDNTNFQGDFVNQTKINVNEEEKERAFEELFTHIASIQNEDKREQAEYNAEALKEAVEAGDTAKTTKLFNMLRKAVGDIGSLITIGVFTGVIPPVI